MFLLQAPIYHGFTELLCRACLMRSYASHSQDPTWFYRRTVSPMGEDLVQSRRSCLSSGFLLPSTGPSPPVRLLSLNVLASVHSMLMKSPASTSSLPEPPDRLPSELRESSPPPEPPDPLDPPSDTSPPKIPFSEFKNYLDCPYHPYLRICAASNLVSFRALEDWLFHLPEIAPSTTLCRFLSLSISSIW